MLFPNLFFTLSVSRILLHPPIPKILCSRNPFNDIYNGLIKNVLETSHLVFLGGTERTSAVYNFEDQPEHSLTSRTSPAVPDILRTYSYNVAGQLASFPHKIGAQAPVTLASETYNDLGQLTAKTFPTIASANQTYAYNIRGWLKTLGSAMMQTAI